MLECKSKKEREKEKKPGVIMYACKPKFSCSCDHKIHHFRPQGLTGRQQMQVNRRASHRFIMSFFYSFTSRHSFSHSLCHSLCLSLQAMFFFHISLFNILPFCIFSLPLFCCPFFFQFFLIKEIYIQIYIIQFFD